MRSLRWAIGHLTRFGTRSFRPAQYRQLLNPQVRMTSTSTQNTATQLPTEEPDVPLDLGSKVIGQSGKEYRVEKLLYQRTEPTTYVYQVSTADDAKYVAKNIYHTEFEYQLEMQRPLAKYPNIRVVMDTVPEHLLFVYPYMTGDLLNLGRKENLQAATRKGILRQALTGLADLHRHNIFHLDVKPDNIFVDYAEIDGSIEVSSVRIGDLEMGCMIPEGRYLQGARIGNPMWRSPESHARGGLGLPSDVFSFGLVSIYTMCARIVMRVQDQELDGSEKEKAIIHMLLSYFGNMQGIVGLVDHLGEKSAAWLDLFVATMKDFKNPMLPFSRWPDVDDGLKDLVGKMTSLDPKSRIKASDALEHSWFKD